MSRPERLLVLADEARMEEGEELSGALSEAGLGRAELRCSADRTGMAAALARAPRPFVLPLSASRDGALQGMLEFLGLAYAGTGLTGMVLAASRDFSAAATGSPPPRAGAETSVRVAVVGGEVLHVGAASGRREPGGTALGAAALRAFRLLELQGWGMLDLAAAPDGTGAGGFSLRGADPWPGLLPGSPLRESLARAGLRFHEALRRLVELGQARFEAEGSLRLRYKDGI